jgi:hypothetical protein
MRSPAGAYSTYRRSDAIEPIDRGLIGSMRDEEARYGTITNPDV